VATAREGGIDVVVTDHHRPPPRLPDALAVVDPAREDATYPFRGLSGSGVAFKLLQALWGALGRPPSSLNRHLDLVAVGTVADVVPLTGENRILVRAGLRALERSAKPGLRALLARGGLEGELTSGHVGWVLGPRLNSAGRVGEADDALRLLLTDDRGEAERLSETLERHNRDRRTEDRRVQDEAEGRLEDVFDPARDRGVVLWGEDWHPGVVGIAASRIVDRVHRPAVLVTFHGEPGRGSARSVPGFHLHEALSECSDLLERFGGHRMAAGLEIRRENLDAFARRFGEVAGRELSEADLEPELRLDLDLPLGRADRELHRLLRHLAPFGAGNPRPVLRSRGVGLRDADAVGSEGRHLKGVLVGDGGELSAIGFGLGERVGEVRGRGRWDVAYELVEDTYRGRSRLQARIRDLRPTR
jgi:single-stranded-DNA-specific exonuclease